MAKKTYGTFGKELDGVSKQPRIEEHVQVLTMIAKRSAERLSERDGRSFREELGRLAKDANESMSNMLVAEADGTGDRAKFSGKLSKAFMRIQDLSEDGLADIDAEMEFLNVVEKVLRRVEAFEGLKSQRINALSTSAVGTMIEQVGRILQSYLPRDKARAAFAELKSYYPKNAEDIHIEGP